ncbi:MAG: response regulator [Chloroflexota bacterium]
MIAEDEADIRNLVAMMAQAWGHQPITFETGQKAWDFLDEIEAGSYGGPVPEFALMDHRMPGKKGGEIAHRIRTIPAIQHIPVVLMTAYTLDDTERADMLTDGADRIISKPLPDFAELQGLLQMVIDEKSKA